MRRYVLHGRFGRGDRVKLPLERSETPARIELLSGQYTLGYGMGRVLNDLAQLGLSPTETGIDLLILAAHAYAADTRISRGAGSQDGWTREIRLVVPVSDPDRWNAARGLILRMLNFLTGDRWAIGFRPRPEGVAALAPRLTAELISPAFDDLGLLSGGLDSLISAIDRLEAGKTPLFISHASEGASSDVQATVFRALERHYNHSGLARLRLWMTFPNDLVTGSTPEDTTRGRSFLFFAIGVLAGTAMGHPFTLIAPENGLIALNVPLDPLRLGALSTRTMHPFYIARWNELLAALEVPGRIENPYWNRTKGEMMAECANRAVLQSVSADSLSCSSPTKGRWRHVGVQHCGYCYPCIIRRAAFLAAFGPGADKTTYTLSDLAARSLRTGQSEGQQVRSLQFAIARLQAKPGLSRILVQKSGPLADHPDRRSELAEVYRRGLDEIAALLDGVVTSPT